MAQGPIIQTGEFTSDGNAKIIMLKADVDHVVIENLTEMAATNSGHGFRYSWYLAQKRSMIMEYHPAADHTTAITEITNAFQSVDRFSLRSELKFYSITAGTDSVNPVYSTTDTSEIEDGSIVRIYGTNQLNLNGLDFTVDNVATNTSFRLANTLATAPGVTAGASGRYINIATLYGTYDMFFPVNISILNITKATNAVITTMTKHSIIELMMVKFTIPAAYGMVELDGLTGVVQSVTDNTITIDIDSTGFTSFKFPLASAYPFDLAFMNMIDETDEILYSNGEGSVSSEQEAYVAMELQAGTAMPAGSLNDEIRWIAYNAQGEDDEFYD